MSEKLIWSEEEIRRALSRIAHEIVEKNKGCENLAFVGMCTRGVPLARRIVKKIGEMEEAEIPVGALDIGLYRDDLPYLGLHPVLHRTDVPFNITGKHIVLVDDVFYTGRTIRAAMDALMDLGRPQSIQLAVLVDRGHRELPIRADYVGKNLPTSQEEEVIVRLKEVDGRDEVVIALSNLVTGGRE